jgi:putative tricarboxylic transport membrane protein
MEERNMPKADFFTSMFFIAFGILVLVMSLQMPRLQEFGVNRFSVPGIVPGFLGAVIAFLGLVLLIRSIARKGYRLGINASTIEGFFKAETTRRLLITIGVSVVYAIGLLDRIPYPLATAIYIFSFIVIFEYRLREPLAAQWKTLLFAAAIAVLISGAVTVVFRYLFLVTLPG